MGMNGGRQCVIEATSLKQFFHGELETVLGRRDSDLSADGRAYLVNLLLQYSRSEHCFEWYERRLTLRPLAMLYGEAAHAGNLREKRLLLRRLGDIALFIAGMFGPSLERKPVGVDYYIDMGGCAYDWLSDSLSASGGGALSADTFRELARKFEEIVDALDELAGNSGARRQHDLLSLYQRWLLTGDAAVADRLRRKGVDTGAPQTWH
jgi:hypothetical protein